ncbi:MAG: AI-2E family transporter [Elusimicrobia bacterium]|nr:AI-2E family transporter [Elusimicrobiota bacterium]
MMKDPISIFYTLSRPLVLIEATILLILSLYTLHAARVLLIPLTLAFLLHLLFMPLLRTLKKARIRTEVGAGLILAVLIGVFTAGAWQLSKPAAEWLEKLPQTLGQMEKKVRRFRMPMDPVSRTTEQVERKAAGVGGSLVAGAGLTVVFLYFMLAYRDRTLANVIDSFPPAWKNERLPGIIDDLEKQVSKYLLTITFVNIGLGVTEGLVMLLVGMPNPALWGVMAGLMNFIPYLCDVFGTSLVAMVAMFTFDSPGRVLLATGAFYVVTVSEGSLLVPMIVGHRFALNPLILFLWLIFWGWMWGVPGAIMAVPMLAILKILCDNIPTLARIGKLLGLSPRQDRS